MTTDSVQLSDEDALTMFDAQAWAFVHFLMFERDGTYAPKLDEFSRAIASGRDANVAFTQSIGDPQRLSAALANYLAAPVYSFRQINADASIPRDGLVIRAVPVAESAATIAAFHAAMRRPAEARAAIAASRKAEPNNASADVAEALLASAEGRADEARSAFAAAVAHGSTNAHAYFSLAVSMWPVSLDRERFEEIRKLLTHSVKLNSRHAAAYSALAEVTSVLTRDESGLGLARRAISLEPDESDFRLTAARVLSRVGRSADALVEARAALNLATNDVERKNAQELIDDIEAAAPSASVVDTKTSGAAVQVQEPPHTQAELMTLTESCNAGNVDACRAIVGPAETQCNAGNAWACGFAGSLHETGRGTGKADPAKAAPLYKSACDRGERRGCVSYALLLARGAGVPKDETAARSALQQACTENVPRACEFLERVFPAKK
jgi:TPR repeat protein